ncbi:UNVERIFIED_CONTAM: hypothetical protein Sangu_1786600 [Sesamum angustifolium]|uniref:Reverse transcriptase n=1 Tax=Sesamum angustifolium TaxID=2727405 RepID=A0AAW2MAI1_9LAMI
MFLILCRPRKRLPSHPQATSQPLSLPRKRRISNSLASRHESDNLELPGFGGALDSSVSRGSHPGLPPRLGFLWRQVKPTHFDRLKRKFDMHGVSVDSREDQDWWRFTGIYGEPDNSKRERTWGLLSWLRKQSNRPWLCAGDFNEILDQSEKIGVAPSARFPTASVSHIPLLCSDHKVVLIRLKTERVFSKSKSKPWRFEAAWLQSPQCEQVVERGWRSPLHIGSSNGISSQLEYCREQLRSWSKLTFQVDKRRIQHLEKRLAHIFSGSMTTERQEEASSIRKELEQIAAYNETTWRQRSKDLWLREGDRNTHFFHQRASHRFQTNLIRKIRGDDGQWIETEEGIQNYIEGYFQKVFASNQPQVEDIALGTAQLLPVVTPSMAEELLLPYTEEEVSKALFQMASFKSPGPDGMPPIFFKSFWHIVHDDVTACVLKFLNSFHLPPRMNDTYIVLIPKCKHPELLSQFRPISLCNVIYKIASNNC